MKEKRISLKYVFILMITMILCTCFITVHQVYKMKYGGLNLAYTHTAVKQLKDGSFDSFMAKKYLSEDEIRTIQTEDDIPLLKPKEESTSKVEVINIYGPTYEGKLLVVHNPSDVYVGANYSKGAGPSLDEYVDHYQALAGINAGGFVDTNNRGDGSIPMGIVIQNGEIKAGKGKGSYPMIGINDQNEMVCEETSADVAFTQGVRDAVTFMPVLISDYQVVPIRSGVSLNNLNPRTAIGQRDDQAMLLLAIDGRGPTSFGAYYGDLIKIFNDQHTRIAANLDGGNSTAMIYDGKYINTTVSMYGSRNLPSAILVKGDTNEE